MRIQESLTPQVWLPGVFAKSLCVNIAKGSIPLAAPLAASFAVSLLARSCIFRHNREKYKLSEDNKINGILSMLLGACAGAATTMYLLNKVSVSKVIPEKYRTLVSTISIVIFAFSNGSSILGSIRAHVCTMSAIFTWVVHGTNTQKKEDATSREVFKLITFVFSNVITFGLFREACTGDSTERILNVAQGILSTIAGMYFGTMLGHMIDYQQCAAQ